MAHYFSHFGSSYSERAAFHDALRAAGFGTPGDFTDIGADEELEGDGYWHHWAFTLLDADPATLRRADERMREIAEAQGVEYDGREIQRNALTDEPRVAD